MIYLESEFQQVVELAAGMHQSPLPIGRYYLARPMLYGDWDFPNDTVHRDKVSVLTSYRETPLVLVAGYLGCVVIWPRHLEAIEKVSAFTFRESLEVVVTKANVRFAGTELAPCFPSIEDLDRETRLVFGVSLEGFCNADWGQLQDVWELRRHRRRDAYSMALNQPLPPPLRWTPVEEVFTEFKPA